jgi:hypothetical protein
MSGLQNPAYEILPPSPRSVEAAAFRAARHDEEWFADRFADEKPSPRKEASPRHLVRFLTLFLLAIAAILAWQSYGHAAREKLASLSPQLQWLAPPAENAPPDRVELISRSVDRIAASIAASQEQITRTIDHLAADQEQMTREIIRLQTLSLDKSPEVRPDAGKRRVARRSPQGR